MSFQIPSPPQLTAAGFHYCHIIDTWRKQAVSPWYELQLRREATGIRLQLVSPGGEDVHLVFAGGVAREKQWQQLLTATQQ